MTGAVDSLCPIIKQGTYGFDSNLSNLIRSFFDERLNRKIIAIRIEVNGEQRNMAAPCRTLLGGPFETASEAKLCSENCKICLI